MANFKSFPHYEINVKDESGTNPLAVENLSLHKPLYFTFAEKGEINKPFYGSYDEIKEHFGEKIFDEYSEYFFHPNVFIKENLKYQKVFVSRMAPPNAKTATMVLELAVYIDGIQQWQKEPDGTRSLDTDGNWIPKTTGTSPPVLVVEDGVILEWRRRALLPGESFKSIPTSTITENGKTKTVYPIFTYVEKYPGAIGNNTGIRIYNTDEIDETLIDTIGARIYRFAVENKLENGSSSIVRTFMNGEYIDFTPKPNTIDPSTGQQLSYINAINEEYNDDVMPVDTWIYADNIKAIGDLCIANENTSDFNIPNGWMVNIIDGIDTNGNYYDHIVVNSNDAYQSYLYDTLFYLPWDVSANANINPSNIVGLNQYLSLDTPLNPQDNKSPLNEFVVNYMIGGTDGDMTIDILEERVRAFMNVNNPTFPEIQDKMHYPITHIYDTGFSYSNGTKEALINFAGLRNDVKIILSTQDASEPANTQNEDQTTGNALKVAAQLHPESYLFGTQACRFTIFSQCGKITTNPKYRNIVPATIDAMVKKAFWHGATYIKGEPKGLPNSKVTILKDINWALSSEELKALFWDDDINYMQYYDMTSYHYPSVKSVYTNETSLLIDDIFTDYITYLGSIVPFYWAKFSGTSFGINTLVGKIISDLTSAIYKAFGTYIRVEVNAYQTELDKQLGYQITVQVDVYDTPSNRVWKVIIPVRRATT